MFMFMQLNYGLKTNCSDIQEDKTQWTLFIIFLPFQSLMRY
jgi:hypothetical protein